VLVVRLWASGVEAELVTLKGAGYGFKGKDTETVESSWSGIRQKLEVRGQAQRREGAGLARQELPGLEDSRKVPE
jgi:hypothetical protein